MQVVLSPPTQTPAHAPLDILAGELDACTSLLTLRGDLDLAAAAELKTALGEWLDGRSSGDLVLDLSGICHIDSTGLAVLLGFRRRLPDGCRLAVTAPSRHVMRLLALTGLERAIEVHADVEQACAHLAQTRRTDAQLPLTSDAAVAVGLAFTALAFGAATPASEADRWARILLPYGGPEIAAELIDGPEPPPAVVVVQEAFATETTQERLNRVVAHATAVAAERSCCAVRLGDIVAGVTAVYGPAFRRALRAQL